MSDSSTGRDRMPVPVDWSAVRRRLEAVEEALNREKSRGTEAAGKILRTRAAALAAEESAPEAEGEKATILEFLLAGESYAIEVSYIRETLALAGFTPLFCTPPFVLGITNVRGRIISIVDLRLFFDLPAVGLSDLNRLIIVGDGTMEFAIPADDIIGIKSLPLRELQSPPPTITGIRSEFLRGITGERLALLHMGKILADRRLVVHEEVE